MFATRCATQAKYLRAGILGAAVSGALLAAPAAQAVDGVVASAAAANMYLWRGIDLGHGSAAVSGDLSYHLGGGYAGVWMSSGDSTLGQEYDYYAGYGAALDDFSFDISLWNYNYSDNTTKNEGFGISHDTTGDLSEIIGTLGWKTIKFSYYDNIAGATGYKYFTLSGSYDKFSALVGRHEFNPGAGGNKDMTHLNLTYSYNDNLAFTASKVINQDCSKGDNDCSGSIDEDLKFVVTYTLPIKI
ncbi:MAG: TorF family putative porin [Porticoccaceae bacterium]